MPIPAIPAIADDYITAVHAGLAARGLPPRLVSSVAPGGDPVRHPACEAIIELDPATSGLDESRWPHGLAISWEWRGTGPDDLPVWRWARLAADGRSEVPWRILPVHGVAPAGRVAWAVESLATAGWLAESSSPRVVRMEAAEELTAALAAWAADDERTTAAPGGE